MIFEISSTASMVCNSIDVTDVRISCVRREQRLKRPADLSLINYGVLGGDERDSV